jgi:hypothetical protein
MKVEITTKYERPTAYGDVGTPKEGTYFMTNVQIAQRFGLDEKKVDQLVKQFGTKEVVSYLRNKEYREAYNNRPEVKVKRTNYNKARYSNMKKIGSLLRNDDAKVNRVVRTSPTVWESNVDEINRVLLVTDEVREQADIENLIWDDEHTTQDQKGGQ